MTRFRPSNTMLAAVALLAASFSAPTWANEPAKQAASQVVDTVHAGPKARPMTVQRRSLSKRHLWRMSRRPATSIAAPYQRVVVHWPMLMLGIGY